MFQITVNPIDLNQEQREAVAALILNFPTTTQHHEEDEQPAVFTGLTVSPDEAFGPVLVAEAPAVTEAALDSKGLPWDDRIHASSRVKVADGTWRRKRGVDDATAAVIEAELKGIMPVVAEKISYIVPPPPVAEPVIAAVPPPPPPVPGPIAVPDRAAFVALVGRVTEILQNKKLTEDDLTACYKSVGVGSLSEMLKNSHFIPQVNSTIDSLLIAS